MARNAPPDLLDRLVSEVEDIARQLEATPARTRDLVELKRRMFSSEIPEGTEVSHFDECFVSGGQNPMGIGISVTREGDEMVARVELGAAFEGAPGRSHGGIVAAIFDDVLGYLLTMLQEPAFTGELSVRYLAPTPIGRPLEFRARVVGREGRRIRTEGEARADGSLVAEASATFVRVDRDRVRA